jgi:5-methyltetrahydropteroyltriglutamate--homocysteine methyltransferase
LLQIDDPRLSTYYVQHPEASIEDCRRWARRRVEVLNYALRGIPEDRVRFHTCYSIDIGPRVHDMDLEHVVDIMLEVNAGAYSFEASNPRHEHEYHVWERVPLPEGKIVIPGVVSHTTNLVEHPDLVAERILRFARIVGPEQVIAGADCGFAAIARFEPDIHPEVALAKLRALGEGARRASAQLQRA